MRRFLFLLVAVGLAPGALSAQRARLDRIGRAILGTDATEVGVFGGPSRTTATGAGPLEAGYRGVVGGFVSVPMVGRMRLRPELAVTGTRVGYTLTYQTPCAPPGPCPSAYQAEAVSVAWLEMPLLVEARFSGGSRRRVTPRLVAGPFVAIRIRCQIAAGEPLIGQVPSGVTEPTTTRGCERGGQGGESYHNGAAGFVVGASLALRGLGLGARWTRTLTPVAPFDGGFNSSRLVNAKLSTVAVLFEVATRLN